MSNGSLSYGVHNVTPIHGTIWKNYKIFVTLQNGQEKVKVKATSLVHNFSLLANCWNHDRRSMSNGSMSYGVHEVTPIHDTMWENSKFLWPCKKAKKKRLRSKQQGLCITSSSQLTDETMIEGQS